MKVFVPKCSICGEDVIPAMDYRKVVGWERIRHQGGTNAISNREPLNEWAHKRCLDRRRSGVADGQTALV